MATKEIYLAGGCFWGTERYLQKLVGVISTEVGYANGNSAQVDYKTVCTGTTNHVETVKVVYDPEVLPLNELLTTFLATIDPTSLNQQGNDKGTQYRTGIYSLAADYEQNQPVVAKALAQEQTKYQDPLVVENLELANYCSAEEYHQNYLVKNPQGYCHLVLDDFTELLNAQNAKSQARLEKLGR
ncbi:peptide-methionine (S)-S-oxide reductase MsrA [Psittacicella hinzii]|uniref:peptide-methionine (S)-S-oxide reductase MsrA n=1 Tax=Psittacicella hinzii TaxID=2028575 RepID=UPI0036208DDF